MTDQFETIIATDAEIATLPIASEVEHNVKKSVRIHGVIYFLNCTYWVEDDRVATHAWAFHCGSELQASLAQMERDDTDDPNLFTERVWEQLDTFNCDVANQTNSDWEDAQRTLDPLGEDGDVPEQVQKICPEKISIRPNWKQAMSILILALESGTPEGKAAAKAELMDLAGKLDEQNAQ